MNDYKAQAERLALALEELMRVTYERDSACAWCQDFYYGGQDLTRKGAALRAVAVRSVAINSSD